MNAKPDGYTLGMIPASVAFITLFRMSFRLKTLVILR